MLLNRQVRVYVPGTVQGNIPALDTQKMQVRHVLERLSGMFGGATAIDAQGAYMSDSKGLIVEPIVIVSAFCDDARLIRHQGNVIALARQLGREMEQECVSVEVNGTMELVSTEVAKPAA